MSIKKMKRTAAQLMLATALTGCGTERTGVEHTFEDKIIYIKPDGDDAHEEDYLNGSRVEVQWLSRGSVYKFLDSTSVYHVDAIEGDGKQKAGYYKVSGKTFASPHHIMRLDYGSSTGFEESGNKSWDEVVVFNEMAQLTKNQAFDLLPAPKTEAELKQAFDLRDAPKTEAETLEVETKGSTFETQVRLQRANALDSQTSGAAKTR